MRNRAANVQPASSLITSLVFTNEKRFSSHASRVRARTIFVALLFGLVLWPKASFAQNVASQSQAGSVLTIESLATQDDTVSGVIGNKSPNTVRDVQLFIRYTFLWKMNFIRAKKAPVEPFTRRYRET